jgi:hypothetical protein
MNYRSTSLTGFALIIGLGIGLTGRAGTRAAKVTGKRPRFQKTVR